MSGDEKLFHFTGNSCHIMLVPLKPSRIGLWMYELVTQLGNGLPILIHMRIHAYVGCGCGDCPRRTNPCARHCKGMEGRHSSISHRRL